MAPKPDLNPVDFYMWRHLIALVSSPVEDVETLQQCIVNGCHTIHKPPPKSKGF
jgi:hypothetical protein